MKIKLFQKFGELIKDTKYYIMMSYLDEDGNIIDHRIYYDESLNRIIFDDCYEFSDSFEAINNYDKCVNFYSRTDASIVIRETEISHPFMG